MLRNTIILTIITLSMVINGCSSIKRLWPGKRGVEGEVTYELIDKLRNSYSEGRLQALEEMIAIYNDSSQPFDVRIQAGRALATTQHPNALNALATTVGEAAALDMTFMVASIELLAEFKDDPRAADAMVQAMNQVEEKTNTLQMVLIQSLNKVRTKDQVLVLLDLYEVSHNNFNRTEKLLTETLGALGTDEVVPILLSISRDPDVNLGIRNRAIEILGKKDSREVANAFAELLGDPTTNLEVREFALNTMAGVKEEKLILALLQTYQSGKNQYYNLLNTLLDALGEFTDPEVRKTVIEISLNKDYPLYLRQKAIDKLGVLEDPGIIASLLPLLADPAQYQLHGHIITAITNLGQLLKYEEEIRRYNFEAHKKARRNE